MLKMIEGCRCYWEYENGMVTYEAEKENGIEKSDYYEGLIDFQIWKYEQLANY